ncbi:MAG TPA: glycerol kinase GlpK [Opitutaceae bacterium]
MSRRSRYILALDQGTTSSRAIVFDHAGREVALAQKEFQQLYPQPGWVEHDPLELWASQNATAAEAIARANLSVEQIAAVGVTNQRETTIVWDRDTGKPVCNAIVWQDRRTADFCAQLRQRGVEPLVTERTGLRLDPYFSATKVRWILDHVSGARAAAEQGRLLFGTVDTWLIWQLTGRKVHVTDVSNASRTLLFNLRTGDWDDAMLELFNIPRALLPEVKSSAEIYGHVDRGLYPAGAPIAGIAGDQQAALFGQACFALMNTGADIVPSRNNLLTTVAWKIGGRTEYALEGSVFIGGAVVQWLRDELQLVRSVQELDQLAASVPDAGGLFLVPAFAGLGAPHWDPYARGAAFGITRGTSRAQFCRAAIESIAFQTADLIACMEKDSGLALKELRVDGGASRSQPLLQFQADLLGRPVVRPKCIETTALGAAYLAGLAVGYWSSRDDITKNWAVDQTFPPARDAAAMAPLRAGWEKALSRSLRWETPG